MNFNTKYRRKENSTNTTHKTHRERNRENEGITKSSSKNCDYDDSVHRSSIIHTLHFIVILLPFFLSRHIEPVKTVHIGTYIGEAIPDYLMC